MHHHAGRDSSGLRDGVDDHRKYDFDHRRQHRGCRTMSSLSPRRRPPSATTTTIANTDRSGSSTGAAHVSRRSDEVYRGHEVTDSFPCPPCCNADDDEGLCRHSEADTYTDIQQQQPQNYHKQRHPQRKRKYPRSSWGSYQGYSHSEEGLDFPQFVDAIEGVLELLTVGHDNSDIGGSGVAGGGSGDGRRGDGGGLKDDQGFSGKSAYGMRRGWVMTMTPELARTNLVRLAQVPCVVRVDIWCWPSFLAADVMRSCFHF